MKKNIYAIVFFVFLASNTLSSTACFGQQGTAEQVTLTNGKVTYELPMAYELMHIAMALTDTTIVSNGYNVYHEIIDTSTAYYKDAMRYFGPYRNHALIKQLNQSLRKSAGNYLVNLHLAYNSEYRNGTIGKESRYPFSHRMAYSFRSVQRKVYNEFAKISKFEAFYQQHKAYYQTMLKEVQEYANVNAQQNWLEKEFPNRYNQYNIIISPLMKGTHFTKRFSKQGNRKCLMWVAKFDIDASTSRTMQTATYTGIVMTEIDHNYVNPVSDRFKKQLNEVMGEKNRSKWTNGGASNAYKTGYKVFNEYMTHAVYLLYVSEQLNTAERTILEKRKIGGMEERRKFVKFGSFYMVLKSIYANRKPNETIAELYPQMIAWCKKEN